MTLNDEVPPALKDRFQAARAERLRQHEAEMQRHLAEVVAGGGNAVRPPPKAPEGRVAVELEAGDGERTRIKIRRGVRRLFFLLICYFRYLYLVTSDFRISCSRFGWHSLHVWLFIVIHNLVIE